jgi:hypothetical protein
MIKGKPFLLLMKSYRNVKNVRKTNAPRQLDQLIPTVLEYPCHCGQGAGENFVRKRR